MPKAGDEQAPAVLPDRNNVESDAAETPDFEGIDDILDDVPDHIGNDFAAEEAEVDALEGITDEPEQEEEELEPEAEAEVVEEIEEEAEPEVEEEEPEVTEEEAEEVTPMEEEAAPVEEEAEIDYEAQNKLLLQRIEELSGQPQETPAEQPGGEGTPAAAPGETIDFLGERDMDEILDSKEAFNKFCSEIYHRARTDMREEMYLELPRISMSVVSQQMTINRAAEEFFTRNPDLAMVRKTCGTVTNEVASEHPDWTLEQVLDEMGARTRKMLGLRNPATPPKVVKGRKPALVKPKGRPRAGAPKKLSATEQDIADTLL